MQTPFLQRYFPPRRNTECWPAVANAAGAHKHIAVSQGEVQKTLALDVQLRNGPQQTLRHSFQASPTIVLAEQSKNMLAIGRPRERIIGLVAQTLQQTALHASELGNQAVVYESQVAERERMAVQSTHRTAARGRAHVGKEAVALDHTGYLAQVFVAPGGVVFLNRAAAPLKRGTCRNYRLRIRPCNGYLSPEAQQRSHPLLPCRYASSSVHLRSLPTTGGSVWSGRALGRDRRLAADHRRQTADPAGFDGAWGRDRRATADHRR